MLSIQKRLAGLLSEQDRSLGSRKRLAWSIAAGIASAMYPQIACTSIMGYLLGAVFRLNHAVIQGIKWLLWPLQWIMLLPNLRLGEWLVGADPLRMSVTEIVATCVSDPVGSFRVLGIPLLHSILGWMVICILAAPMFYLAANRMLMQMGANQNGGQAEPHPK